MDRAETDRRLRDRGAAALDATLHMATRGPRTAMARGEIARRLDAGHAPYPADVAWLERIAGLDIR